MSACVICAAPNGYVNGGYLCLPAYGTDFPACVCRCCTTLLGFAWAKEMKRQRDFPPNGPTTPTSPPSGDTQAAELSAMAA